MPDEDRLARGHEYVQRMLCDEAIPRWNREWWRAIYEATAQKGATLEDLLYLAKRLDALKAGKR